MTTTVPARATKCHDRPPAGTYYHIQTHGGLGDCLWLLKKMTALDLPLYISVSTENRTRPRRVGPMLDHIPTVMGWDYVGTSFGPNGADWTRSASDPACAIGQSWADLKLKPNRMTRLECNRWLESGRRIEDWLPDLPTVHRLPFDDPGPGVRTFKKPTVVFHLAGWPDVPDPVWIGCVRLFIGLADVYVVGGSYDRRPRNVFEALRGAKGVHLMEDVGWADLYGVLAACDYCFGHASGFTAIADALGVQGVTFNPRAVPHLIGTWNDLSNTGMVHVDRVNDFEHVVRLAYMEMSKVPAATWPPTSIRGSAVVADARRGTPGAAAVYAATTVARPRQVAFVFDAKPDDPTVAAACVHASLDAGDHMTAVNLVGSDAKTLAGLYAATTRTTKRPVIDTPIDRGTLLNRPVTYGLIVVVTNDDRRLAHESVLWAWSHLTFNGCVLVAGPSARNVSTAVAATKGTEPAEVSGAPGWFYLHKQQ